jgi:rare lipoprotein A
MRLGELRLLPAGSLLQLTKAKQMKPAALAPLVILAAATTAGSALGQTAEDPVVFKEKGQASYYGGQFHGRPTASGVPFDQNAVTAAHPKLPLGTEVTVTNQNTGKTIKVEVNDRRPYVDGRDIDLSKGAAQKLGIVEQGIAKVEIEATKQQVEEAIDSPKEVPKVERQLDAARDAAAAGGTPQPKPVSVLEPPPGK